MFISWASSWGNWVLVNVFIFWRYTVDICARLIKNIYMSRFTLLLLLSETFSRTSWWDEFGTSVILINSQISHLSKTFQSYGLLAIEIVIWVVPSGVLFIQFLPLLDHHFSFRTPFKKWKYWCQITVQFLVLLFLTR